MQLDIQKILAKYIKIVSDLHQRVILLEVENEMLKEQLKEKEVE
jgi:hypothetical protein